MGVPKCHVCQILEMVMSNVIISVITILIEMVQCCMHFVYLDCNYVRSTSFHVDIVMVHCRTKLYDNKM